MISTEYKRKKYLLLDIDWLLTETKDEEIKKTILKLKNKIISKHNL
jgi:hypothetical protein